ncbi:hypothetical protein Sxan_52080 [Streptomyces xanthophaeus]|uniref:Uncharacterized protein n=1 Tax=Streptomyces xanthophaeus TaxID=67385 RepID=A0A919LKS8_9ACTN|nr:hypothetical protein Sxan_52080 [Streptomyces xanthophaeus]
MTYATTVRSIALSPLERVQLVGMTDCRPIFEQVQAKGGVGSGPSVPGEGEGPDRKGGEGLGRFLGGVLPQFGPRDEAGGES